MIGKTISHYKITEKLGGGGMGVVYKAQDIKLDRFVALKFLPPELVRDEETKKRFIHEAKAASSLQHHNICTIHDINETEEGQLFICMDYYEGETLKQKIEKGPLETDVAIDIIIQIAAGLQKAHEKEIIHRDIKPANIFITNDGIVKILDFGLAKLSGQTMITKMGSTLGTVAYMSPEQTKGEMVDHRTDIWSLGVVLYEMIICQLPFKGDYEQAVIYSILNEEPPTISSLRSDVPKGVISVIGKSLQKDCTYRYQTMKEFIADLKSGRASTIELPKQEKSSLRKNFRTKIIIGALILLVLIVAGYFIFPKLIKPKELLEKSIAVLPFVNNSPDQENTYFINGVMEEILTNLQTVKDLRVISRTSVEQYRNQTKSIPEIARELGVNYILEGSGQKYGSSFRLRVQLIMAKHESHIWGESFQQKITEVEDIFNIQIRIAKLIANKLKAVITPEERKLIDKIPTADLEVYDEYLKARSYWTDYTKESLNKAKEYLNSAIEKNPDWAPLYAGLAEVWIWIQQSGWEPPSVAGPKILENLNKAMELDPDLAEVHYQSAVIAQLVEWDWGKSEKEFLKALAINPNNALCRLMYAQLLLILDRDDESLEQRELAISLDPLNPTTKLLYIGTLVQAGDYKTSLSLMEEALAANPGDININGMLEIVAYRCKEYDKVIRALKYSLPFPFEEDKYKEIEKIYRESGIVSAYEELMKHLEKNAENKYIGFFDMAIRYIIANQPDKAMDWIEKGFELHDPLMTYITRSGHFFDTLFGNPRFIAICKKMKLPI